MPIIKSAIKRVKQTKVKTERNRSFKSKMLTIFKNIHKFVISWDKVTAVSFASEAYSIIDTAAKKNIIKKNNAWRKKSSIAKLLKDSPFPARKINKWGKKAEAKVTAKPKAEAKAPAKKAPAKKAETK